MVRANVEGERQPTAALKSPTARNCCSPLAVRSSDRLDAVDDERGFHAEPSVVLNHFRFTETDAPFFKVKVRRNTNRQFGSRLLKQIVASVSFQRNLS
jgi:hypothetical protein